MQPVRHRNLPHCAPSTMGRRGPLNDEYGVNTHLALQNARRCFLDWDPEGMQADAAALQGNLGSLARKEGGMLRAAVS